MLPITRPAAAQAAATVRTFFPVSTQAFTNLSQVMRLCGLNQVTTKVTTIAQSTDNVTVYRTPTMSTIRTSNGMR